MTTTVDRDATLTRDVYLRELIRLQLTVSAAGLVAFGALVGALPLLVLLWPSAMTFSVGMVPGWLLLLGPPPFLLFFLIARLYTRRADALDDEFSDLVQPL